MPKLTKSASGLILYDDFSVNNLIWNLSPNNYNNVSFGNGLKMHHNQEYMTISIIEPTDKYSFMCKISHTPVNDTDIGGVIVISDSINYVECQSYIADSPSYITNPEVENPPEFVDIMYPYIKFNKLNNLCSFFASHDGIDWVEIGNTQISDANRIGFFLHGVDSETALNGSFVVEYVIIYSNNYIVFDNIKPEQNIELWTDGSLFCTDKSGYVIRKNNKILIDTTNLRMPLNDVRFVVTQDSEVIYDYTIPQLVGGDLYTYGYNLKVCVSNQELDQERLFYLGEFYHKDQTVKIDIYNNEDYSLKNLKVTITSYSVYYGGEETMGISLYDENEKKHEFKESVVIPNINPTEGKSVLLKLTDKVVQDFYKAAGSYRFKINIE